MTKRIITSVILALSLAALPLRGQDNQAPNILFIAVDDLKPMLGCYGEAQIHSPHIDALAARGTAFLKNYCQQAICGPSRASLMTGLYPDHTGVWDLKTRMRDVHPDILTLPQYFRQNGYTTVAHGKVYDPRCVGADYDSLSWSVPYVANHDLPLPEGIEAPMFAHYQHPDTRTEGALLIAEAERKGKEGYARIRYGLQSLKPVTECADVPDNAYYDGIMVEQAMESVDKLASSGKPFFLAVGFKKPHLPFVAPKKYWDLYDRDAIEIAAFQEQSEHGPKVAYHKSGEIRSYTGFTFQDGRIPEEQQKKIIHGYYAAISYVDALVGKLLKKLEDRGLDGNTVVILWGDHGWHLGDHALWCKHSNFEQATRAPMIISAPGMPGEVQINTPTDFIDIFPTLCDLAGLAIPEGLDGVSLEGLISQQQDQVKPFVVSQYPRGKKIMGYSLRTERYRYTEWHTNGYKSYDPYREENIIGRELYDYAQDPLETVNYFDDPSYETVADRLSAALQTYLKEQKSYENRKP